MNKISPVLLLTLAFLVNSQKSSAEFESFASAAQYNAVVFGDFSANSSDVEGRLAVKGNVNINHYSVGDKLQSDVLHDVLISGGDISFPSGRVYYGNILAAGSISGIGSPVLNGMAQGSVVNGNSSLPVDFNQLELDMMALSQSLSQLPENTSFESQWGGLYLHGDCSDNTQVFNLDGAVVLASHTFQVDCISEDAFVVFNISGQDVGLTNMSLSTLESHRNRVIFNFHEANELTLSGISVEGTVLAPQADINNPQGVIKGQLIAKSWNGMMQINNNLFAGGQSNENTAPEANNQFFNLTINETISFNLDTSDANNDVLSYSYESVPLLGSIDGTAPELSYTPTDGFIGKEQLTYIVNDGELNSELATVTFNVGQSQCELYPYTIEQGALSGLQTGDQISNYATSVGSGNYSLLSWNGNNDTNTLADSFIMPGNSENYLNPNNENDTILNIGDWVQGVPGKKNASHVRAALDDLIGESIIVPVWSELRGSGSNFDYKVVNFARIELTDYKLNGQPKISFIFHENINCGNFAPFTLDAEISTDKNVAVTFGLSNTEEIVNDVQYLITVLDADDDNFSYEITTPTAHGILSGSGPVFTYTPENEFYGTDSFNFKVNDGSADSNESTVTISVIQTNQAPEAISQSLQLNENQIINITLTGIDPDNDPLTYSLENLPSNGQLSGVIPDLAYTPNANYFGLDSFTFTVTDGEETSQPATVNLEVLAVNDAPQANDINVITDEDMAVDILLSGTDSDGDANTFQLLTQPNHGVLSGTVPELAYTPNTGFSGNDTFTYSVNDGQMDSNVATVNILINPINDAPVAFDDSYSTVENLSIDLQLRASDSEGDSLVYIITDEPEFGRLYGDNGSYVYTPSSFYDGIDSFKFKVNDGEFDSNIATVTIDIEGHGNNPPNILSEPVRVLSLQDKPIGEPELTDLSTWIFEDFNYSYTSQPTAKWELNDNSTVATQIINSRPSALLSDFDFSNQQITGTFRVNTYQDDDYIGFVFGYQNRHQHYAFVWKKNTQGDSVRGMSLFVADLSADGSEGDPQFGFFSPDEYNVELLYQNNIGWASFNDYEFNLSFQNGEISVTVADEDNNITLDSFTVFDDTFSEGKFGFYNYSQSDVEYAGFERLLLAEEIYYYDVEAVDPDGDVLVYELLNAPPEMSIDSTTGLITWIANTEMIGIIPVSVLVTDVFGATDIQNYDLIVSNDEPVIVSQPKINTRAEELYAYSVEVYDPSPSDVITYQLLDGPVGMSISENTGQLTWSPASQDIGTHDVSLIVTDTAGNTDTQNYTLEVTAARINSAPVFETQPPLTATVGRLYSYVPQASDADSDPVTIALVEIPYGMQMFDGQTITWIPTSDQVTDHQVELIAVDPWGDETRQSFTIEVVDVNSNRSPTINSSPQLTAVTGTNYQYQLTATDPDNDILNFALLLAPQGMVIDENTGLITWLPGANQYGYFDIKVAVNDGNNGFTQQNYQLTVFNQNVNLPPVISSQPPTQVEAGELYVYNLIASDPNGDSLTHSLQVSPLGMTIDSSTGHLEWLTTSADIGTAEVIVEVRDINNAFAQQSFSVQVVTDTTENQSPVITSSPVLTASVNSTYSYDVIASDPDLDVLRYTLNIAPPGLQINSNTGNIIWTPTSAQTGLFQVEILVEDLRGGSATQSYSISVESSDTNNPPSLTSTPGNTAKVGQEYTYQIIANDPDGDVLNYQVLSGPVDMNVDSSGLLTWTPTDTATQQIVIRVDDGQYYIDQGWTIITLDQSVSLDVTVTSSPANITEGDEVTIQAVVLNAVEPVSINMTIDGNPVTLDENYSTTFIASGVGTHEGVVEVTDAYETISETFDYLVRSTTASDLPVVDILSPADGSIVTGFSDVQVSVQDDNLANWKLSYRYAEDDFTDRVTLAEGTGLVDDEVVAKWDTSLLRNGIYVLLIEATDLSGQQANIAHSIFLEGDLKLGHFSIAFEDMNIPVAGIPIIITRGYDTRDRNRDRAFGKGWSIGYQSVRVQESRIPGLGWAQYVENFYPPQSPVPFPRYCIEPAGEPLVSVNLPDGTVEKFKVKARTDNPTPDEPEKTNCQDFVPPQYFGIEFIPQGDTTSTITSSLGSSGLNVINGNLEELTGFEPVNPNQYTLTMEDGTIYSLDQGFNVREIETLTGHTLTFTENGIEHSGGLSVVFIRDSEGRITRIEKADGMGVDYTYDASGDLASFTDLNGNTTTYTYIQDHYLEDIIDPRGIRVARNEYDADGSLVAHIDANGNRIEYDNDLINMTSTITDRRGNTTINAFDNAGNIIAQTNALGETTSYEYNDLRLETAKTNHLGHRTEWTYDASGNQLTETDPLGHVTTSSYNARNELLTQSDALGQTVITNSYIPDGNTNGGGQLGQVTDALGRVTEFHWLTDGNGTTANTGYTDALGNKYDITPINGGTNSGLSGASTDLNGLRTETTYDDEARPLTETHIITDENGVTVDEFVTTYEYNANGDVITMTDALGHVTRTEYDALNKVSATIDALGRRTEMEYDDRGNQVLTRYPDGSTETMVYDEENNVIESTDRAGRTTKTIYDALNRVEAVIYPDETPLDDSDNPMTVNTYDGAGRMVAVSDANGNTTTYVYDDAGRRTQTTDAIGNVTTSVYDALGRRTQSTDAHGRITTFEYNALGNLTRTNFANGSFTTTTYDELSRKVGMTDLAGLATAHEYDDAGNLTAVIDALGQRTEYTYDQRGNKLTQTDANGNTTSWAYDALSRVVSRTLPLGEIESYTYDAVGNRVSKTDFNGDTTTYEYNNLNQLVLTTYADLTTVANTYTITGQMHTVTEVNGTTVYLYDSQDRLSRIDYPTGNYIEYSYDLNGNKTEVTTANQTVTNTYDELNRLETVTDASGTTTYTYDAVGNRASQINTNGTVATYSYDALNRLEDLVHTDSLNVEIASYSYELGPNGNRLSLTEDTGRVVEYEYDDLYRLLSETVTDPINGNHYSQWTYDPVGNRLQQDIDGVVTTYIYNDNDHLLSETEDTVVTAYVYDANGNTLTKSVDAVLDASYSYSKDNRMLSASTNGSSISYTYDAGGIRQSQTVDGTTTHYLVDPNRSYHQVLEEQDDLFLPQVLYTYGDDLINQANSQGVHTFGYDGLGSTRILTDSTGIVQNSYGYQAFGELDYEYGSVENNYLFTGEQYDNNVGFYYLRARYYNPENGRFTQMDTFPGMQFEPKSLHKYLYTHADPINNIDPSGNITLTQLAVTTTALGIVAGYGTVRMNNFIRQYNYSTEELSVAYIDFNTLNVPQLDNAYLKNFILNQVRSYYSPYEIEIRPGRGRATERNAIFKNNTFGLRKFGINILFSSSIYVQDIVDFYGSFSDRNNEYRNPAEIAMAISNTVTHEIGHSFGLSLSHNNGCLGYIMDDGDCAEDRNYPGDLRKELSWSPASHAYLSNKR